MTTAVIDLADFLRARLDQDEKTAGRCCYTDQPWISLVDYRGAHYIGLSCARVLAEVRAKRQIVRLHAECGTGSGCCDDAAAAAQRGSVAPRSRTSPVRTPPTRTMGRSGAPERLGARATGHGQVDCRLPSSSQFAATFFDGCTRGGSPGIFG